MRDSNRNPLFVASDINEWRSGFLERLFAVIEAGDRIAENDHLMKCILRIIIVSKEELVPITGVVLDHLKFIVREISRNPSNPKFNHYAFESVSALVKFVCKAQPTLVTSFEDALFPSFNDIVSSEVLEFTPYVFQIYAQLLELHSDGVTDTYAKLLPPLMQARNWENFGNIPALINLLTAFLKIGLFY
jgi:exportin-2 (importin alpha re-exporter)